MSLAWSTAGTSGGATAASSKDDDFVQKFYDLIDQEKAAPIRLKEFATQLRSFFAAFNALNDYLRNPEFSPKDDVEILKNIPNDCGRCAERCQTFLMTFLNELGTSAGGKARSSSQLYQNWTVDTAFLLEEKMKALTATIILRLSPNSNSEGPPIELMPTFSPLAAVAPPYDTRHGYAGMLFKSCADLFLALTREAGFLDQLQEKQRLAFREIFGNFYFGSTGSLAEQGELDKTLDVSARLKDQTVSLLVQIAKKLCSEETGLFQVIDKAAIDGTLSSQRQKLLSLLDFFGINAYQSEYSDTDSVISEDGDTGFSIENILDELGALVGCLTKLGFSLDRPAPDPAPAPNKAHTSSTSLTSSARKSQEPGHFSATNILPTLQLDPMDNFKESKDPLEPELDDWSQYKLLDKRADVKAPLRDDYNSNAYGKRKNHIPLIHGADFNSSSGLYSDNLQGSSYLGRKTSGSPSIGFSLSDVKFAYDLGKLIYDTCFTKANRADVRYFEFGKDIQTLAESLDQLIEVTENAVRQRQPRPRPLRTWTVARQDEQRGPEADLKSLREVTGDFSLTLRDCDALLRNHHKFHRDQAGFVDNVFWHASTESEISNLKERVRLHIAKLSFVIKPFEIQLLVGIRNELIQLQQDVRDLAGLMINLSKDTTRDTALPSLPSIEMPSTPDVITKRFIAALDLNRPDAFRGISDFPLKEGFDALVFHFAKSTVLFNPGDGVGPSRKVPKETQYLNLLKAKWILEKLKASSELAAAAETDSLWLNCEREVELEVMEQCRRFEKNGLTPPPLDNIIRLPDDCFTIWIFEPPPVQPHLAEARALEEKILDLILPNHASLTIFQISDDDFRVVHTTITPETSKEVERESFSVNMQSTQLVPAYAIPKTMPPGPPSGDILLHRAQDLSQWQRLKDLTDVFSFQQALTGYRVYFDASNVKWSLNGSEKPGKCGMARVQLWEARRLSKLPTAEDSDQSPLSSGNSWMPGPHPLSEEKLGQRRWTRPSSTITSSSGIPHIAGNRAFNATFVHPPEPPILIIYTLCDGKLTFLHVILGEEIFVNESACLCKKSPTKCLKIVLSSKKKRIKLRKHCSSEPGSEGLDSWDLARFRIPRHPRYKDIEVVEKEHLCLVFQNNAAKAEFRDELRSLFKYVRDLDIQEYHAHYSHRRRSWEFS